MNKKELQNFVKDLKVSTKIISARTKMIISQKVFDAYRNISKARKQGRTDLRYPYRIKKFYPTEWNGSVVIFPNYELNIIKLTTSQYIGNDGKNHNGKQLNLKFKTNIPQNIKTIKLIHENGCFYACISYTIDIENKIPEGGNITGIDLGEIHSITSVNNYGESLIITGRKIRSIKQFRNKKYAELKSKMSKCKKGSRQYNKYRIAKAKIGSKCQTQLYYCIHKLTRMYTNWAVEKGISAVVIGDVEGIEQNNKKNKIGNTNVRQKLSQWNYGQIMWYLEYKLKLELEGITLIKVSEAYTSQTCPVCGNRHKPKNREYICPKCGSTFHRDCVGAYNILRFNTDSSISIELPNNKLKYLRIA
jgi:putative transposase